MSLTEKVAYIKGVVNGMNFDATTPEGKIIELILDLLSDMADDVTDIAEETETLGAYIEEIDEDLGMVEDIVYEDFDDCDCSDDDCHCHDEYLCDGNCEECECEDDCEECEKSGEYDFYKVVCPSCNEEVYLDNSLDPAQVRCPACHNEFSVIEK